MSHPDLIIAAGLAPEEPIVQLGRRTLSALQAKLRNERAEWQQFELELLDAARRLGLIDI